MQTDRIAPINLLPESSGGSFVRARRWSSALSAVFALSLLFPLAGCVSLIDPNVPAPIRAYLEPEFGREYLLYRPSSYNREQAWPLIIVCHTSLPDSPNRRIRAWTELAEETGFLVAAPKLSGTRSIFPPGTDRQMALQRQDEKHILTTIRHIRAGYNVSWDRIFLHGFSGGAYAALHCGLKHPEIFRAISVSEPRFDDDYLTEVGDSCDPTQPVLVSYSVGDVITGRHGQRCVDWLRSRLNHLTDDSSGAAASGQSQRHVEFFEDVIREHPWLGIRALPAGSDDQLAIRFRLRSSLKPKHYRWEFGDGESSNDPEPIHTYQTAGTYRMSVVVEDSKGNQHRRTADLAVPQATIAATPNANAGS